MQRLILLPFLRSRWRLVLTAVGTGFLNSAVTLLLPLSLGRFYQQLFGGISNREQALDTLGINWMENTSWSVFFGLFAGLILLRGALGYVEFLVTGRLGETFVGELRERVFAHQLAVPTATHRRKNVGRYLLRYGSDFGSLRRYLTKGLIGFTKDILFVALAGAILLWLNPLLTGLLIGSLLPFLLVLRWINGRLSAHSGQRRDLRSAYLSHVATRLSALETIKVFNREAIENEQFTRRSASLSEANTNALAWRSRLEGLLPVTVYALIFVELLGVHALLPNGVSRVNGGIVITFILLTLSLRPVLRRLLRVDTVWRAGRQSLTKLTHFLTQPSEHADDRPALAVTDGHVTFDAVSFAYDAGKPVLADLSFSAGPGTVTQLSGGPGAGKTTAFKLLLGLYVPGSGTIRIDGQNIATCSVVSVRKQVTLVSADAPLLGRTVFETISYSRKPDKRSRAEALLNDLQTVADLPVRLSLDDPIGEQGQNLSEGERSVLRLVRALLTRKPILLLDEPFRGFSDETTVQLMAWLYERRAKRTMLLVSSRQVVHDERWMLTDVPMMSAPLPAQTATRHAPAH